LWSQGKRAEQRDLAAKNDIVKAIKAIPQPVPPSVRARRIMASQPMHRATQLGDRRGFSKPTRFEMSDDIDPFVV
jgi:hypothetical protein